MVKRVRLILDGVEAVARLHEEAAPETFARFWAALPIETTLRHVLDLSGTLLARPDRGEVLISCGAAEYRSVLGVEYGTRIGRVVQNRDALLDVLARMHDEGDKRIAIRRAGTA